MGKTKIYEGRVNATLTGINGTAQYPVIDGLTLIKIYGVIITFEKLSPKQCKVSLEINIPELNNGPKKYIATGYYDGFGKVSFSMNMILDNQSWRLLVTEAEFDLKKGSLDAIGLVNKEDNNPQGTLIGKFKRVYDKKCDKNGDDSSLTFLKNKK